LTYSSTFSTITVFRSPAPVHEVLINVLQEGIKSKLQDDRFEFSVNEPSSEFEGSFESSTKIPDLLLRFTEDDPKSPPQVIFIAQVGFSETYSSLKQSMALWLEQNAHVKIAVLIKVSEKPQYRTPKSLPDTILKDTERRIDTIRQEAYEAIDDKEGLLSIHGVKFVGQMSAYLEIWTRDRETGKAVRRGDRIVSI